MRKHPITRPFAFLMVLLTVFGGLTLLPERAEANNPKVQVVSNTLNVRNGPGPNFRVLTSVRRGTVLAVLERRQGWLLVKFPGGDQTGWVSQDFVTRVK